MVDPVKSPATPAEAAAGGLSPETVRRFKLGLVALAVILVGAGAWAAYRFVSEESSIDAWEQLANIERVFGDEPGNAWVQRPESARDIAFRDEFIRRLEDFLAKNQGDDALAAHVHARIAEVQTTQILQTEAMGGAQDLPARYESVRKHLETLRDRYPNAAINEDRFKPPGAGSVARLSLQRIEANRAWEEKYGIKKVEADPDPVVVLRTTEGDVRLRFYASASPELVRRFLDRACSGALDGTAFFERRDSVDEGWVVGGDARTKGSDASDAARLEWGKPTPGEGLLHGDGRHRIQHDRGTVSAWHEPGRAEDDPDQFLVTTKVSRTLDHEYTPFAHVDGEASYSTLDRIAGRKTRVQDKPDIRGDSKLGDLADQLTDVVWIRRALVYEKGVLKACHDAAKVDESERKLDTLKLDAYREAPKEPAKPAEPSKPEEPVKPGEPAKPTEPAK